MRPNVSEQPNEELRREQRESPPEDDAGNLSFGAALAEHEHQSADHDRDERERSRERPCERPLQIARRSLPWRLRQSSRGKAKQDCENRGTRAPSRGKDSGARHDKPPATVVRCIVSFETYKHTHGKRKRFS